jgi:hypothetical protein
VGCPALRGLPKQHANIKRPHADEVSSGSEGSALKVHRLVAPRYITHPPVHCFLTRFCYGSDILCALQRRAATYPSGGGPIEGCHHAGNPAVVGSAAPGSSESGAGVTTGLTTVDTSMAERAGEGQTVEDVSKMCTAGTV